MFFHPAYPPSEKQNTDTKQNSFKIKKQNPIINKSDRILFFYLDYVYIFVKEN